MCGNSGRREALITFFFKRKVSISLDNLPKGETSSPLKAGITLKRIFS